MQSNQIDILKEVVKFLGELVEEGKSIPGHVQWRGGGSCSWECGPKEAPRCLYRKFKILVEELKKEEIKRLFQTIKKCLLS